MIKVQGIKWQNTGNMRTYYNRELPSLQVYETAEGKWCVSRDNTVKGVFHLLVDALAFSCQYISMNRAGGGMA